MKIVFTGDLFLGGDLLNKSTKSVINSNIFNNADFRFINLEQPISDNEHVANKCTLHTDSSAIEKLKQLNITAVNLAHNHIQDKENDGIIETIEHLNSASIGHFGAGKNIHDAKNPYWINDKTCILGYCEFDRPYLKQIQVATDVEPGVNPLRYDSIIKDLNILPEGTKAFLYFHWGREHVWFPPRGDIELAKRLLEDDRILAIIGMHCHRIQGYIDHNGKRAYMSLGNFLFPNFFIKPPTQITYPEILPEKYMTTKQYHSVNKLTYKKWRIANRVSLILEYDTEIQKVNHIPVIQNDDTPRIKELSDLSGKFVLLWVKFISMIYQLPKEIYDPIERLSTFVVYKLWRFQIRIFKVRQYGIKYSMKRAIQLIIKLVYTHSH